MNEITVTRNLDALGRITLPFPIREQLNLKPNDKLGMYLDTNNCIVVKTGLCSEVLDYRKLDKLGRLVINISLRKIIGLEEGDCVDIIVRDKDIIFAKKQYKCIFCNSEEDLIEYRDKKVCLKCTKAIAKVKK